MAGERAPESHKRALFIASCVAAALALAGCGGGGGKSTAAPPAITYTPNYISSLDALYHWTFLPVKVYFETPDNWTNYYPADLTATAAYGRKLVRYHQDTH